MVRASRLHPGGTVRAGGTPAPQSPDQRRLADSFRSGVRSGAANDHCPSRGSISVTRGSRSRSGSIRSTAAMFSVTVRARPSSGSPPGGPAVTRTSSSRGSNRSGVRRTASACNRTAFGSSPSPAAGCGWWPAAGGIQQGLPVPQHADDQVVRPRPNGGGTVFRFVRVVVEQPFRQRVPQPLRGGRGGDRRAMRRGVRGLGQRTDGGRARPYRGVVLSSPFAGKGFEGRGKSGPPRLTPPGP